MRIVLYTAAAALAAVLLGPPAHAQFGDEGLGIRKTCPPYCPKPVRPRGGNNPTVPEYPKPDHPRPDHPKPGWHPPIYHDYDYYYGWPRGLYPRRYRDPYFASPYYYDDDYYDGGEYYYAPPRATRLSCAAARSKLRRSGYRVLRTIDCKGKSYGFIAERKGKRYKVTVSARSGAIVSRKRY